MKNTLLVFVLMLTSVLSYGQIIQFADANFKNALVNINCVDTDNDNIVDIDADINNDGEIEISEAIIVKSLILDSLSISNLDGIEKFLNLEKLNCHYNSLNHLSISNLTLLQTLRCSNNLLNSLDINNLVDLKELNCSANKLTSLDLSKSVALQSLKCTSNLLTSLDVSNLTELQTFWCSNNQLVSLDLSNLFALEELICTKNQLTTLDVSNLLSLQTLWCSYNLINSLNIPNLPLLQSLECVKNELTTISLSDLPALQTLICSENLITSLNLSNLPSLQKLNCNVNQLTSLNIANLLELYIFDTSDNKLKTLNLFNLPALEYLRCHNNQLSSLDVSKLSVLQYLSCSGNQLTSLDVSSLTALKILYSDDNQLTSLNISNLPLLAIISCFNNQLKSLVSSNLPKLTILDCNRNQLTSIEVSSLTSLSTLSCHSNQLTSINVSNLSALKELNCSKNQLTSLDVTELSALQTLYCSENQVTSLDLSNLPDLRSLSCYENQLTSINLKNGRKYEIPGYIYFKYNPNLKYFCCDEKNTNFFKNIIISYGNANVEVNTYCNFDPGGIFSNIIGDLKYDFDQNGCDSNDVISKFNKIYIKSNSNSGYVSSDDSGKYDISLVGGNYTIIPKVENPDYYSITPDSILVTVSDTLKETITQDFCILPRNILRQTDLSIIPLTPPARPGFYASYKVVMTNKGNQVENGTLYFAYDEAKMDFVLTDVSPTSQSDGLLSWDFTDLLPFETRYYNVTLNVNSPSETPPVNAGDDLLITCNILDNVFLLRQEVVGSYDPNDKTCLEGKTITPEQVGKYVHYLIRFENTGNYAAENVVVKDVINESTFDISTLQITDASHEAWARINGNIVEFIFENIQLPFDDASNDGYICFKIKTKPTLVLGNELKNEANIYFDYNLPILTNKTNTVVALPTSIDEAIGESDIEIFPNPVRDVLKFSGDDKVLKVEIFDMSGRLVQVSNAVNGEVNVERMVSGVYVLKLYGVDKISFRKMIKN